MATRTINRHLQTHLTYSPSLLCFSSNRLGSASASLSRVKASLSRSIPCSQLFSHAAIQHRQLDHMLINRARQLLNLQNTAISKLYRLTIPPNLLLQLIAFLAKSDLFNALMDLRFKLVNAHRLSNLTFSADYILFLLIGPINNAIQILLSHTLKAVNAPAMIILVKLNRLQNQILQTITQPPLNDLKPPVKR